MNRTPLQPRRGRGRPRCPHGGPRGSLLKACAIWVLSNVSDVGLGAQGIVGGGRAHLQRGGTGPEWPGSGSSEETRNTTFYRKSPMPLLAHGSVWFLFFACRGLDVSEPSVPWVALPNNRNVLRHKLGRPESDVEVSSGRPLSGGSGDAPPLPRSELLVAARCPGRPCHVQCLFFKIKIAGVVSTCDTSLVASYETKLKGSLSLRIM